MPTAARTPSDAARIHAPVLVLHGTADAFAPLDQVTAFAREMDASQLWETTMNPEQRLMLQVTLDDAAQADEVFSVLMGEDVVLRRGFIQRNAKDVRFLDI